MRLGLGGLGLRLYLLKCIGPTVPYFTPLVFPIESCCWPGLSSLTVPSSTLASPRFLDLSIKKSFVFHSAFVFNKSLFACCHYGGTRICSRLSDGAATAISDLHRCHVQQRHPDETWYSRAGLYQRRSSTGTWYQSFRNSFCIRTGFEKRIFLSRQPPPRSPEPEILPLSTSEEGRD